MTSKTDILASIRRQTVPAAELPSLTGEWIQYADPEKQFCETLAFVGGQAVAVERSAELAAAVQKLPCLQDAQKIVCTIPGLSLGNVDMDRIDDPHALADVDVAILPGEFMVAENAAIWIDGRRVKHRAIYFLTQHLVVVVPRQALVHNLGEAYQRLSFADRGYGLFLSGPSKTADIEQSLVIGAHGPRSMTAVLVGAG